MNKVRQDKLRAILEATFDDGRLSRGESTALRAVMAELADEREALAFARNTAFEMAAGRIEAEPTRTLDWLRRVDKIIDNAGRRDVKPPDLEVRFSPGDGVLDLIRAALHNAEESIDVCVFTITDDRITDALLDAHRDDVAVRIVTDNAKRFDRGSDIARLAEAGVPVRHDPSDDHMHHKFAVIDRRTLLGGSYNWTRGATRNHENLVLLRDPRVVRPFIDAFEGLWKAFRP